MNRVVNGAAALGLAIGLGLVAAASARAESPPPRQFLPGFQPVAVFPLDEAAAREQAKKYPRIAKKRTIYMNRHGGVYYRDAVDESTMNKSRLVGNDPANIMPVVQIPGSSLNDTAWAQLVTCVRLTYAPFAMDVVDVEPPASVDYIEIVVTGSPTDIGRADGEGMWGGVASGTPCDAVGERNISFAFEDSWLPNVPRLCAVVAQETAHPLGLDHEMECTDPMSYLWISGGCGTPTAFQDVDAPCGEFANEGCECGGSQQNSYQKLLGLLGPADEVPPTVAFDGISDGATVTVGFVVDATADDNVGVTKVELWLDGQYHVVDNAPPWKLETLRSVAPGAHTIELRAYDNDGNTATAGPINVTVEAECQGDNDCPEGFVCVDGAACLGDYGSECVGNVDCATGLCAQGDEGGMICTSFCEGPMGADCPSGTVCTAAPGGGLDKCLPAPPAGCGCRAGGGASGGQLAGLAALLLCLFAARRRW